MFCVPAQGDAFYRCKVVCLPGTPRLDEIRPQAIAYSKWASHLAMNYLVSVRNASVSTQSFAARTAVCWFEPLTLDLNYVPWMLYRSAKDTIWSLVSHVYSLRHTAQVIMLKGSFYRQRRRKTVIMRRPCAGTGAVNVLRGSR